MKLLSSTQISNLITKYASKGGEVMQTEEGGLTSGDFLLYDPADKLKFFVIKEVFVNEWSSMQSVRGYNKIPKKYIKIITNA